MVLIDFDHDAEIRMELEAEQYNYLNEFVPFVAKLYKAYLNAGLDERTAQMFTLAYIQAAQK